MNNYQRMSVTEVESQSVQAVFYSQKVTKDFLYEAAGKIICRQLNSAGNRGRSGKKSQHEEVESDWSVASGLDSASANSMIAA